MIAAVSINNVIGRGGKIPWRCKSDMEHFHKVTMGHVVIMGGETYRSIGFTLDGRVNCVLSQELKNLDGVHLYVGPEELLEDAMSNKDVVWVIGGSVLYQMFMAWADEIWITRIKREIDGDTFFPDVPSDFYISDLRLICKKHNSYLEIWKRSNSV